MSNKNQSNRLTEQHKLSQGVIGIFGDYAKAHDLAVGEVSKLVKDALSKEYPQLSFRYRDSIRKTEINESLKKLTLIWEGLFLFQIPASSLMVEL